MSDGRNIIYLYDGSFDGLLTAVFDSYYRKEVPVSIENAGHSSAKPVLQLLQG